MNPPKSVPPGTKPTALAGQQDAQEVLRAATEAAAEIQSHTRSTESSGAAVVIQSVSRLLKSVSLGLSPSSISRDVDELVETAKEIDAIHDGIVETAKAQAAEFAEELETLRAAPKSRPVGTRSAAEVNAAIASWTKKYTDCQIILNGSETTGSIGLVGRLERLMEIKKMLKQNVSNPQEVRELGISNGHDSIEDQIKECNRQIEKMKASIAEHEEIAGAIDSKVSALKRHQMAQAEIERGLPDDLFTKK
ncbi:MAG TPA: hypothetical protein VFT82_03800 [Candidatus Paceibacterota bacterium]|nr:hypothetical protein [Candidatus Paceibacterota bacterium]